MSSGSHVFFCAQYRFLVDGYVVMEARKLVRRLKVLGREEYDDDDDDDDDMMTMTVVMMVIVMTMSLDIVRHLKVVKGRERRLDIANAIVDWEHWCKNVSTVEDSSSIEDMVPVAPDTIKGWSEVQESDYPIANNNFLASVAIPTSSLASLGLNNNLPLDHLAPGF